MMRVLFYVAVLLLGVGCAATREEAINKQLKENYEAMKNFSEVLHDKGYREFMVQTDDGVWFWMCRKCRTSTVSGRYPE